MVNHINLGEESSLFTTPSDTSQGNDSQELTSNLLSTFAAPINEVVHKVSTLNAEDEVDRLQILDDFLKQIIDGPYRENINFINYPLLLMVVIKLMPNGVNTIGRLKMVYDNTIKVMTILAEAPVRSIAQVYLDRSHKPYTWFCFFGDISQVLQIDDHEELWKESSLSWLNSLIKKNDENQFMRILDLLISLLSAGSTDPKSLFAVTEYTDNYTSTIFQPIQGLKGVNVYLRLVTGYLQGYLDFTPANGQVLNILELAKGDVVDYDIAINLVNELLKRNNLSMEAYDASVEVVLSKVLVLMDQRNSDFDDILHLLTQTVPGNYQKLIWEKHRENILQWLDVEAINIDMTDSLDQYRKTSLDQLIAESKFWQFFEVNKTSGIQTVSNTVNYYERLERRLSPVISESQRNAFILAMKLAINFSRIRLHNKEVIAAIILKVHCRKSWKNYPLNEYQSPSAVELMICSSLVFLNLDYDCEWEQAVIQMVPENFKEALPYGNGQKLFEMMVQVFKHFHFETDDGSYRAFLCVIGAVLRKTFPLGLKKEFFVTFLEYIKRKNSIVQMPEMLELGIYFFFHFENLLNSEVLTYIIDIENCMIGSRGFYIWGCDKVLTAVQGIQDVSMIQLGKIYDFLIHVEERQPKAVDISILGSRLNFFINKRFSLNSLANTDITVEDFEAKYIRFCNLIDLDPRSFINVFRINILMALFSDLCNMNEIIIKRRKKKTNLISEKKKVKSYLFRRLVLLRENVQEIFDLKAKLLTDSIRIFNSLVESDAELTSSKEIMDALESWLIFSDTNTNSREPYLLKKDNQYILINPARANSAP